MCLQLPSIDSCPCPHLAECPSPGCRREPFACGEKNKQELMDRKQHVARVPLLLIVAVQFRPYVKVHWSDTCSEIRPDGTIRGTRLGTHQVLLSLRVHMG